jgi:hypothetical protein
MAETEITWETVTDPEGPPSEKRRAALGITAGQIEHVGREGWLWSVSAAFPGPTEAEPLILTGGVWDAFDTEAEAKAHAESVMRRMQGWWEREQGP